MYSIDRAVLLAGIMFAGMCSGSAAEWQVDVVPVPSRITALETSGDQIRVVARGSWYAAILENEGVRLQSLPAPKRATLPQGGLPDSKVAIGQKNIARAWLAEPTTRYAHGVLGDAIEAGSLVVERRDGRRDVVRLSPAAVFEDLEPRIVELDNDGEEKIIVVKSYVDRGACLAVIGTRDGRATVVAETPPLGGPNRWLNPAGIADFDGDGQMDIAIVRMPHAVGQLELWSWRDSALVKMVEFSGVTNHVIGSRVLRMSGIADFDGDGKPDLAIPSFDRREMLILAFWPRVGEIARVRLPANISTEIAVLRDQHGSSTILVGLEDGSLIHMRR